MLRQTFSSNLKITAEETILPTIGEAKILHPKNDAIASFELLDSRILLNPFISNNQEQIENKVSFAIAGPRRKIYFDPTKVRAGIVTCGGICPGLNNVIRAIVLALYYTYGCKNIVGFKNGLQGFIAQYGHPVVDLNPNFVSKLHERGGTVLGTSRGPQPIEEVVDTLERMNINQLYMIGGDGSLRAAEKIAGIIQQRGLKISLVGVPKTIDNDIPLVSESFGFDTAVEKATAAISAAHIEATSTKNGIGLVKLMGRNSGFIAAIASLAQRDVNFVLIPEQPFELYGEKGFLRILHERMKLRQHAVIVVAEGAGQNLMREAVKETDASGNKKLKDIGWFMKEKITAYFAEQQYDITLKYIDPSYMIRSVVANTHDGLFAATLGQNAVHGAMAGLTSVLVSIWHGVYCYVPLKLVTDREKRLSLKGRIWLSAIESTGQPNFINE